jgi:hypothetical protein
MCIRSVTIYTGCTCAIPETECCPRCPKEEYEKCRDFRRKMEVKKGVGVGVGPCPFFRCRQCRSEEEEGSGMESLEKRILKSFGWDNYFSRNF